MRKFWLSVSASVAVLPFLMGGCTINVAGLEDAVSRLAQAVELVQINDPRDVELPDALVEIGGEVVLDSDVDVIVDIEEDLDVVYLPDSTVVGFDNQTGLDIYLQFYADDELQGVYVFDGETLLLDYPCLTSIELATEDDIDPVTGFIIDSFELSGTYFNPDDFICGDAIIFPFEPAATEIVIEIVDLIE